jgi:hypothetical protein
MTVEMKAGLDWRKRGGSPLGHHVVKKTIPLSRQSSLSVVHAGIVNETNDSNTDAYLARAIETPLLKRAQMLQ